MTTELAAVSTFGWFTDTAVSEDILPISTFGWYLDFDTTTGDLPDVRYFSLYINTVMAIMLER